MAAQQKTPVERQEIDNEGFLLQAEIWDKNIARSLAQGEVHDTLTPDHWKVIDCVREHYLKSGIVPSIRRVVRSTGFSIACIHELFPNGYIKGICKIAGIPRNKVSGASMSRTHNK